MSALNWIQVFAILIGIGAILAIIRVIFMSFFNKE